MPANKTGRPIDFGSLPDTFEQLCRYHPPRPIHDDRELENLTEIVDAMAGHELNADQADYLDLLSTLVDRYEQEHHPMDTSGVSGVDLLRHLMDEHGLAASDVAEVLDVDRSLVAHVLNGNRSLTWHHAKALSERFGLPPSAFMD